MMPKGAAKQHTQQPMVTGTSVVALKFKDGVVMAADNLGAPSDLSSLRIQDGSSKDQAS